MQIPSWLVWYKKPEYRDIKEYASAISSGRRSFSPDGRSKVTIPSRLQLERILANKTCSPMSLYDFYMYLKYIEFSPENLEFYVWFKNYEMAYAKFASTYTSEKDGESIKSSLPSVKESQKSWDPEIGADTIAHIAQLISLNVTLASTTEGMPEFVPPQPACGMGSGACLKPTGKSESDAASSITATTTSTSSKSGFTSNLGPSAELRAVVKTYLLPGSDKELNIPSPMRNAALRALQHQQQQGQDAGGYCDPEHLRPIADHAYMLLKNCSHRNFVRLGVSNGTYETICVATSLGIVLTFSGFLLVLLRALYHPWGPAHTRWEAFAAWPFWWLGISLILSGLRGSCFFLLLFSRRQPLPWERFDDDDADTLTGAATSDIEAKLDNDAAAADASRANGNKKKKNPVWRVLSRLMIFDRKLKVKDEHLRRLQHKVVIQSLVSGAVFASLGVLMFLWLPVWAETS